MAVPVYIVDAFATHAFAGNPAAVCLLDQPADASWMQAVAAEMNLSETAFVTARGGDFGLRWFTPAVEVALCGHATLASAHVLWQTGRLASDLAARFETLSGRLTATHDGASITLDFPADPTLPSPPPPGLLDALAVTPVAVARGRFDYVVEVADADSVRGLAPDFARLAAVKTRGVVVTALADRPGADFVSRFFAPGAGVAEDPVTGSAHCTLVCYWAPKLGRDRLVGRQLSKRGGEVHVTLAGDRAFLSGQAVTVLSGMIHR